MPGQKYCFCRWHIRPRLCPQVCLWPTIPPARTRSAYRCGHKQWFHRYRMCNNIRNLFFLHLERIKTCRSCRSSIGPLSLASTTWTPQVECLVLKVNIMLDFVACAWSLGQMERALSNADTEIFAAVHTDAYGPHTNEKLLGRSLLTDVQMSCRQYILLCEAVAALQQFSNVPRPIHCSSPAVSESNVHILGVLQEEQWETSAKGMTLPQNLAQQGTSEAVPRYCLCNALHQIYL